MMLLMSSIMNIASLSLTIAAYLPPLEDRQTVASLLRDSLSCISMVNKQKVCLKAEDTWRCSVLDSNQTGGLWCCVERVIQAGGDCQQR